MSSFSNLQDVPDATVAVISTGGDADHTDCQERIQELEAKIERLEQQLIDGDVGAPVSTVAVSFILHNYDTVSTKYQFIFCSCLPRLCLIQLTALQLLPSADHAAT